MVARTRCATHCDLLFLVLGTSDIKMLKHLIAFRIFYAALASAQNTSTVVSVSPAAEKLPADVTPANLPLFDTEVIQLTEKVIAGIKEHNDYAEYASLVDFGDSPKPTTSARTRQARGSPRCKTMPGD